MIQQYKLLGTLEIVVDGVPSQLVQSVRGCALVSYLIVTKEAQTREHIADLLWESTSTQQALRRLRQLLYRIRPFIPELQITRNTIGFQPTPETYVDFLQLDKLLSQTDLEHLERALLLYRGNLLNNIYLEAAPRFNEWLLVTQEQLRYRIFNVFRHVCKLVDENKQWERGVALCRHWVSIDELNEEGYRRLIHMLLGQGEVEAAYQAYEKIYQLLQDELGVEPEEATTNLVKRVQAARNQFDNSFVAFPEDLSSQGPLPPNSIFPYHRNVIFEGRHYELQQLAETLLPNSKTSSSDTKTVVIAGMGGLGKSQLAVEFAYRYGRNFSGGVFWLNFADADNVTDLIANVGGEHALRLFTDGDKYSLDKKIELVKRAWQEPTPRLLIFDNCEDENLAASWLPITGGCRALITSRLSNWSKTLPIELIALPPLKREDSIHLLQHLAQHLEKNGANKVAEAVGDLPLALHLAGSFLGQHQDIAYEAYIAQLKAQSIIEHRSLRGSHTSFSPTGHELDVGRTFAVSWQKLSMSVEGDQIALALLDVIACFAPNERLPQPILIEIVSRQFQEAEPGVIEQAIQRLISLGFIRADQDETAVIHPLIAAFVQVASESWQTRKSFVEATIIDIMAKYEAQDINLYQLPLPAVHMRYLIDHVDNNEAEAYQLNAFLGNHFITSAAFEQADELLIQAEQIALSRYGASSFEHGHVLYLRCRLQNALGQLEETLELGRQGLDSLPVGPTLTRANLLAVMGHTNLVLSRPDVAKHHFAEALQIHRQIDDLTSGYYANLRESLGQCYLLEGNFQEGLALFREALAILQALPSNIDIKIANTLNVISATYGHLGNMQEAKAYGKQSLHLCELSFGIDSLMAARPMTNLGVVEWRLGDFEASRDYFEKVLEIYRQYYPENHFLMGGAMNNVGEVLSQLGEYDSALEYHQTALKIRTEALGDKHYETLRSLSMIGEVYLRQAKYKQASETLEKALTIQEEVDNNPQAITDTLSLLAEALMAQEEFESAKSLLDRAYSIREEAFGADNLETAVILMQLGDWHVAMGQQAEAAVHYQNCLSIYEKSGETIHPNLPLVQSKLAALI